jgi:ADP-ribose pyrophosphatase YjhB (NUDIX family)
VDFRVPEGDDRPRFICEDCHTVFYQNPKLVVGCIPVWEDKILFCRRSIEPRYGKWTIPAGYLEKGETVEAGAARETHEEAGARVEDLKPFALYDLTFISQVYLIFRGNMVDGKFRAGHESLEVRLLKQSEIPWNDLAFRVIREILQLYLKDLPSGRFAFHMGDIKP